MNLRSCAGLMLVAVCGVANAGEWEIQPSLTLEEHYTDNVFSSTSYKEDFFTVINPEINIKRTGSLINLESNASFVRHFYTNFTQLNSSSRDVSVLGQVGSDHFPLGLDGSIRDLVRTQSYTGSDSTTRIGSDNRENERAYYASPYLKLRLGNIWDTELRMHKRAIRYEEQLILNQDIDGILFKLSPQKSHVGAFFGLNYRQIREDYVSFADNKNDHEYASAYVGMRLLTSVSMYYEHGYERNDYSLTEQSFSGGIKFFVADWNMTPNSHLKIQLGDRFYGDSYGIELGINRSWYDFVLDYKEEISSEQVGASESFGGIGDLRFYLPVHSELFVDKRLEFESSISLNRVAIVFRGLKNDREFKLSNSIGKVYEAESNVRFMIDHRTDMEFGYQKVWISDDTILRTDSFDEFSWLLQRRLGRRLIGEIHINKLYRNSSDTSTDYGELEFSASVSMSL